MTFGVLYIIATPIGNLADITIRALEILRKVNLIAAEDTRHSRKLLQHYLITTPLFSLHEHNEHERVATLLQRIKNGENIALISDAGTPLISDPGFSLVREAQKNHIQVIPLPGPCAAIAALSVSGLPTDRFIFEGFLPAKTHARRTCLQKLIHETGTLVFYEAPHRILDMLNDLKNVFGGEREITIAKELTKMFETIRHGYIDEIISWLLSDPQRQKGEFVILVQGASEKKDLLISDETNRILDIMLEEMPVKQAVKITEKITGMKKNLLYKAAINKPLKKTI